MKAACWVTLGLTALASATGCRSEDDVPLVDPGPASAAPTSGAEKQTDAGVPQPRPFHAVGHNGVVVTGTRFATDTALALLTSGGNAADAAAAAILALSVSDHESFHFGGEVMILVYDAHTRAIEVIAGVGEAPRLATRERTGRGGTVPSGWLAATVPAVPDAIVTLLDRHGSKTWKAIATPTQELLKKSKQPWYWKLERTIRNLIKAEEKAGTSRARGLRLVSDAFYRGEIARDIAKASEQKGGLLRFVDLATHVTRVEEPAQGDYHGHRVWTAGAITEGPTLLETLLVLDSFSFKGIEPDAPRNLHLAIEAGRLARADRDAYLGDPLFSDVPLDGLVYPYYASLRRKLIDLEKAAPGAEPGDPRDKKPRYEKKLPSLRFAPRPYGGTTCVVADRDGNLVAATAGGSGGVEVGETGVWLGTRLEGLNGGEGHPNAVEPGKRPLVPFSPVIVTNKDGDPEYALSVAGRGEEDQVSLQVIMNLLDFGMRPDEAVGAPRFGRRAFVGPGKAPSGKGGGIELDPDLEKKRGSALRALGHDVHAVEVADKPIGTPAVVFVDRRRSLLVGAGDPRAGRQAAAF